jgi:hypothetical protein
VATSTPVSCPSTGQAASWYGTTSSIAPPGQRVETDGAFRRGAELGPAVDDHDPLGDAGQRQRPVDRGIAAAGDYHPLAAQVLAPLHHVEDAAALVGLDAVERRAVRPEGADAGRHDDGPRQDAGPGRGLDPETIAVRHQRRHLLAEVPGRVEGRRLLDEAVDEIGCIDLRMARDVVDRLLGIERGALAARHVEGVDDMAAHAQHPALEDGEQPDGPGADDDDVGLVCGA